MANSNVKHKLYDLQNGWLDSAGYSGLHIQAVHRGWRGEGAQEEERSDREAVPTERRQAPHSLQVSALVRRGLTPTIAFLKPAHRVHALCKHTSQL